MSDDWQKTICILCSVNCGVEVKLDGRHITRVRGNRDHVASKGYACEKAQRIDYYQNGRDRLTSPLRRRPDGTLRGNRLGHRHSRGRRAASSACARLTAARASSITAAAGRAIICAAVTARRRGARLDRYSAPTRWRRKRPASSGSITCFSGRGSAEATSMLRSRYSSARIRGSRMAFSAPVRSSATSRPIPTARSS